MKSLKIFVIMGLMLLFGGTCFAQQEEEFQRDSVWGLEWNLQDSILTVSFMSSCDGYTGIMLTSYEGGVYRDDNSENKKLFLERDGVEIWPKYTENAAMEFVSLAIDTLSIRLTRYTLSVKLGAVYLTIPQNISSYCGYFGVMLLAPNHDMASYVIYWRDLTQGSQFLYFNLLGSLTWNVDYRSDSALYKEVYYSMAGVPLRNMPENEPVIVVKKDANDRIVSSKVRIWRP